MHQVFTHSLSSSKQLIGGKSNFSIGWAEEPPKPKATAPEPVVPKVIEEEKASAPPAPPVGVAAALKVTIQQAESTS